MRRWPDGRLVRLEGRGKMKDLPPLPAQARVDAREEETPQGAGRPSSPTTIRSAEVTRLWAALATTLVLAQGNPAEATPESRAAALFLLISPSVRVNGMGEAGVALPDEPGGYYNPGASALSSSTHTVQSRLYLRERPWLPALADDMSYGYRAVQLSTGRAVAASWGGPARIEAALYGYRTKIDFGETILTGERGEVVGTFTSADASNNVGVSLALRSFVEVGFGATSKWISSDLGGQAAGSARAYDFGLMALAPAAGILERITGWDLALSRHLRPRLDVGYGIAWHNRGPGVAYRVRPGYGLSLSGYPAWDPLPANRRRGWSGSFALDWRPHALQLTIGKVTLAEETYRPQIEGVQATSIADDYKRGFEVSILETISFRRGEFDDFDGEVYVKTSGRTIRSEGLFRYVAPLGESTCQLLPGRAPVLRQAPVHQLVMVRVRA